MNLNDLELHDARLLSIAQDVVARQVDIRIAYYPTAQDRERVEGTLRFTGVHSLQQLANFDLLAKHAGAGNITQLITGEAPQTTQLFLARGLVVVVAESVALV